MDVIPVPLAGFIILIILAILGSILFIFIIVYFFAGVHDLIVSDIVAKGKKDKDYSNCPYEIDKN